MAIGKNFIYLVVVLIYLKISVPSMNANYDADKGKEKAKSLNPSSCIIVPAALVTDCGSPSLGVSLGQRFHLPVLHLMSRAISLSASLGEIKESMTLYLQHSDSNQYNEDQHVSHFISTRAEPVCIPQDNARIVTNTTKLKCA
ncbi:Uncharacterized protein Fot_13072 [Forsythia ovata]|uniref:Uncharacterized protein n=1 Tax=Forsythia ovata TaxID=205694 RepID=A0ABD1W2E7_9LAMI